MKILWLSHLVPYPPKAGVLLRAHYLVKELAKYHEVHLLSFNQKSLISPYFDSYEEGTAIAMKKMQDICTRVEFIDCPMDKSRHTKLICALKSLFSGTAYNINWLHDKKFAAKVSEWRQQEKYDLIHCDTISLAPYISDIEDTRLSLDHHNVESHMLTRRAQLESNWLKKFYFWQEGLKVEKHEKALCPIFDTNLTCSELDSRRFEEISPSAQFTEIPNGVDIEAFTPGDGNTEQASFIFIGTLDWYPNTRAVRYISQEIWPRLKLKIPGAKMTIIGSGAPADLISLHENDSRFNVLGFVDDLKPYLDAATIYLCPIDDGGGTKLKLLDAFASGKAVIAHPVACEGLKVIDGQQVMFADSPEQYIQKIEILLGDKTLRLSIEKNARKHAEDFFSFAAIGKQLADHFVTLGDKAA